MVARVLGVNSLAYMRKKNRMPVQEQLLRFVICFLVSGQTVVIAQVLSLLTTGPSKESQIMSTRSWVRSLEHVRSDRTFLTEGLIDEGRRVHMLLQTKNLAAAEAAYEKFSQRLAATLELDLQNNDSLSATIIRRNAVRTRLGFIAADEDPCYLQAQVLSELAQIQMHLGHENAAEANWSKAATIYRDLQANTQDYVTCLKNLQEIHKTQGQHGKAEEAETELHQLCEG